MLNSGSISTKELVAVLKRHVVSNWISESRKNFPSDPAPSDLGLKGIVMVLSHTLDLTSDMTPYRCLPSKASPTIAPVCRKGNRPKSDKILCQDLVSLSFFFARRCAVKCAMDEIFLWVSYDLARFPEPAGPVRACGRTWQNNIHLQFTHDALVEEIDI